MKLIKPLKPPTSYTQQLALLRGRGCGIVDDATCEDFLSNVNYYRLSGYFLPFHRSKNDDTYKDGTTLEQIQKIYAFDKKLRNLVFAATEEIEIRVQTRLAYYHAHKYGSLGYRDRKNSKRQRSEHNKFVSRINSEIEHNINAPCIRHHVNNYGKKFPIWVIIEYFSFSMLSQFYAALHDADRIEIATTFGTKAKYLESWLHSLTVLRNKCAHYSRLYFGNFTRFPKFPSHLKRQQTPNDLFVQLLPLKLLSSNSEAWNETYLVQLSALVKEYSEYIDRAHIGFPSDWETILKNATIKPTK
jgi:abortive infection bacteriophage resistance protein